MQKNTTGQKFIVFAFDKTNNNPIAGDAANITANIRKDYGSSVATNDVNPTEQEDGFYAFDATQAETNANVIQIFPESTTADVQVILVGGIIYTTPVGFGDDVIQSADHTTAIADIPTTAEFNARTLPSANYSQFDHSSDLVTLAAVTHTGAIIPNVTLVDTTTLNTDMRGTNNALLSSSYEAPDNSTIADTNARVQSIQLDYSTFDASVDGVNVSTNNDKSGYSLTQAFPVNFSSMEIALSGEVNSDAKKMNGSTILGNGTSGNLWRGS